LNFREFDQASWVTGLRVKTKSSCTVEKTKRGTNSINASNVSNATSHIYVFIFYNIYIYIYIYIYIIYMRACVYTGVFPQVLETQSRRRLLC
jgi:hypothetical protein